MKKHFTSLHTIAALLFSAVMMTACQKQIENPAAAEADAAGSTDLSQMSTTGTGPVLLTLDGSTIYEGEMPTNFTDVDINKHVKSLSQRATLRYFARNVGRTIDLYAGEVGDEGFFALKTIPASWRTAGPTASGTMNYLRAGRGLGTGLDPEALLDKVPNVTPLRARGLSMLTGKQVIAVVYDSEVDVNYAPLDGSLKGETLGLVSFEVVRVTRRTNGSSGSLPVVTVKITDANVAKNGPFQLFSNAPVPTSSSTPFDVRPPATIPAIRLVSAP